LRTHLRKKTFATFAVLAVTLNLPACHTRVEQSAAAASASTASAAPAGLNPDAPSLKVWVSNAGVVELDGKPIGLEALAPILADLGKRKGVVLYGRDNPQGGPPPNGMKVIQMVIDNKLAIRMSLKRDFSDIVPR
jgi:hypothetical protein